MAGWWRGLALVMLVLCSVSLAAASDVDGLQELNQDFGSRKLLQALTPPVPAPVPPTTPAPVPPTPAPVTPTRAPGPAPVRAPAPAPVVPPAPPTPVRTYLMYVGIAAFCVVILCVFIFCLCRKFGQNKVGRAQRLPPLPRYH
ncbi:hypothetical protein KC19_9G034600 [Ceratodon purpureus]|uniref:Uncharacterized protein n=1 Tax=Ceratodon purpureus TaxID=3225 RepID=A0A8T0GRJ6_CERPU|nr:hypothetical protein KC19_9G034600 [Ceratodon purpureus]KAG0561067.1 hypothetical protein KC19_9G034600 [Ceratodon purpureus]